MPPTTHKVDRVSVDGGEGNASSYGVAQDSTDHHPWRKLQGRRDELPIQLQVAEVTLTTQETQRDVTRLQMLRKPEGKGQRS